MIHLQTGSPASFSWADGLATMVPFLANLLSDELDKVLLGGGGPDTLVGADGRDLVWGARGDDVLWGEAGDDFVGGGQGADVLSGGIGQDWVQGGSGPDYLSGADLTDFFGEMDLASDTLDGGRGNDRLTGGGGADTLIGGRGDDLSAGNEGADVFVFDRRGFGHDRVVDFTPEEDRIDLRGLGLEFEQMDTNRDGVVGVDDRGVSVEGPSLVVALRGGIIELIGVTVLTADDVLI